MNDEKLQTNSSIHLLKSPSIRRTFNICDILAKPSELFITPLEENSISDCDESGKDFA